MKFSAAGVEVAGHIDAFNLAIASPQNFIIFDMGGKDCPSVPSSGVGAQVIVLSSANASHFDTFHREYKLMVVMQTWSKEEIDETRQHLYNEGSLADYALRFRDLGGVPRWVFDRNKNHAELVQLFRAEIPSADDIHKVLELKDLTKINVDKGARLVTYEVDGEMQVTQVRWVSDRVGQWAMETLAHASVKRTMDLLCELSENPAAGGAFGIAFEAWAHLKLSEGGSFDARPLIGGGAPCKVMVKPSETKYFDDFKEVNDQVSWLQSDPHQCSLF
ncbi:MAG: hypothetical protein Q7T57_06795 [Dehalococcoidales bacterium]|nr:hypothetical protein [Dehalococcoidales bacterium]